MGTLPSLEQASTFEAQERWTLAEPIYRAHLQRQPKNAGLLHRLGLCLQQQRRWADSLPVLERAKRLEPRNGLILLSMGDSLLGMLRAPEAEAAYQEAQRLLPTSAAPARGLGQLYLHAGQLERASEQLQRALELEPDSLPTWTQLGFLLKELGDADGAIEAFQRVLDTDPEALTARFEQALMLPVLYRSEAEVEGWRRRYLAGLQRLCTELERVERAETWVPLLAQRSNFYLQYQGKDDLLPQKQYGALLDRATHARYGTFEPSRAFESSGVFGPSSRPRASRLRIGYFSACFRDHTVGRLFVGFHERADTRKVERYTYYYGAREDAFTKRYIQASEQYRHMPRDPDAIIRQARKDGLDVAIFNDIGMEDISATVGSARVAPVQGCLWGHPVTTGLAAMDCFLSSEAMEPEQGEQHYTERLIRLPGLGICYERPKHPPQPRSRQALGLPSDRFCYLSCQSLYKYLPAWDRLFPAIAEQVPQALFVFLIHHRSRRLTATFQARLKLAFAKRGMDWEKYCVFAPRLSHSDYLALNLACDVLLDTPEWSGGNTSLEALGLGKLVVTLPGTFMRGRHTTGMLRLVGLDELVAPSAEAYVGLAARLAHDPTWKDGLEQALHTCPDGLLFADERPVRALEALAETWSPHKS